MQAPRPRRAQRGVAERRNEQAPFPGARSERSERRKKFAGDEMRRGSAVECHSQAPLIRAAQSIS